VDDPARDPGWPSVGPVSRTLWTVVMPGARVRLYHQQLARGHNGLTLLRIVYVQCIVMTAAIGAVLLLVDPHQDTSSTTKAIWAGVVVVVGVAAVVLPRRFDPRLPCTSDAALATGYSNRFFIRVSVAQAPTLAGFVAALVAGSVLVGFVGIGFSLAAYLLAAPTRRQLAADQHELDTQGCHRSLVAAIGGTGRPPADG
jgi:hypothetical protein